MLLAIDRLFCSGTYRTDCLLPSRRKIIENAWILLLSTDCFLTAEAQRCALFGFPDGLAHQDRGRREHREIVNL
jgi:hypothetical protein